MRVRQRLSKLVLLLAIIFPLILVATPVYAISDPDSISVESTKVYEGLWEAGDMLFLVEYKVMYTVDPTEDPQDTFLLGVWEGAVKGPDRALDYYQHNFTSVYLTAAQVASFGYEYGDELKIRVTGNPSFFPSLTEGVNMKTVTLTSGHWLKGTTLEETRQYLADWCIILAETFETSWGTPLLTSGGRLNPTGTVKFKEAIPSLDEVCPCIFQVYSTYPEYGDPTYGSAFSDELESRTGARLTGVLAGLGQWTVGKPDMGGLVGGILLAILFFVLAGRIFIATNSVPASIAVGFPFILVGNVVGILSLAITFVAVFLIVVVFAITFILGRLG